MGKIFDLDSPVMRFLTRLADLMILNIATLVCCLPVITIGPALTAASYVAMKIKRREESYILRDFWKSFKMNFKQATIIWLILMVLLLVFAGDIVILFYIPEVKIHIVIQIIVVLAGILVITELMWVFGVLAKFDNSVKNTMKNALLLGVSHPMKTILIAFVTGIMLFIFFNLPHLFLLLLFFGFSFPIYFGAGRLNKVFRELENEYTEIIEELIAEEEEEKLMDDKFLVALEKGTDGQDAQKK